MRMLWSLPKAAPAILRHLVGYFELAAQDLERTHRDLGSRLIASVIFAASLLFVIFSACLLLVALTWDTQDRVLAIGCLVGGFVVIAVIAGLYSSKAVGRQAPFLDSVRREWAEDRVLMERILADKEEG